MIEIVPVALCLIFAIVISLYHLSFDGYLGLSRESWNMVWSITENCFALTLCFLIGIYFSGALKILFRFVFIPYFIIKLAYHFSCLSGVYILPSNVWEVLWSITLVILFIVTLVYCWILIYKKDASEIL